MKIYDREFWYALALLMGTIIGVGLFGLPYVTLKSNIWIVLAIFTVLGITITLLHHFLAEISLHTKRVHHLPGIAEKYIGKTGKHFAILTEGTALFGAQIAYLIVGGSFLARIFQLADTSFEFFFGLVFFAGGAWLIWHGIRSIAKTELILLILLVTLVLLFFIWSFSYNPALPFTIGENTNPWMPYGVIVFSLWGLAIVPEITFLLKGKEKKTNRVLFWGVFLSAVIYLLFIGSVLSITGMETTPESLAGLSSRLPSVVFSLALLFGVLTTFSSFVGIGLSLKEMFQNDYNFSNVMAWIIAMGIPLFFYLLGFKNFLKAISISGSLGLGFSGILIFIIYLKIKHKVEGDVIHHPLFTHKSVIIILIFIFLIGAIISVYNGLNNL